MLLQGICDTKKLFLDAYAGEAGSIHDARLFRKSDIYQRIRNNSIQFPFDSHLIGDLAYPLSDSLMVEFKDNGHLTNLERHFNQKLSQVRVIIENTFALLKGRFRRLKMVETVRLDLTALLIISACILHNICLLNNDILEEIRNEENADEELGVDNEYQANNDAGGQAAFLKRNNIANILYHNRQIINKFPH